MAKSITPFLMFEGNAEEAVAFYLSLFPGSTIDSIERFGANGAPEKNGKSIKADVTLNGQKLTVFDSPVKHAFTFTPSISLFVECASVEEIDTLFAKLSEGGKVMMGLDAYPFAKRFAWVGDRFGVSWQIRFN